MISANGNRLNQVCSQKLRAAGQQADPGYLFSLQLARYGLDEPEERVPGPAAKRLPELRDLADQMFLWSPDVSQDHLLAREQSPEALGEFLESLEPAAAALQLVENLYDNLRARHPQLAP